VTAPGDIEFAEPALVIAKFTALPVSNVVLQAVTGVGRPVPVSVSEVIVVAEPGFSTAIVSFEVAASIPEAVTPP